MNFDLPTVIVCGLVVAAAVCAYSWSLAVGGTTPPWRRDWALGNTVITVGIGLLLTRGVLSPWISVILANSLLVLGNGLLEHGLRRFARRPAQWSLWAMTLAAFLLLFVVFTFVWNLYLARVIVYAVVMTSIWARILLLLGTGFHAERKRYGPFLLAFETVWVVLIVFTLARMIMAFGEPQTGSLLHSNGLVVLLMVSVVGIVAWTLGLVTLEMLRNQLQLEASLETRDRMMRLIAHDLRGPVSGQMGLVELMQSDRMCREDRGEMLDALAVSARNSYSLLENLLDWAQSQQGSMELLIEPVEPSDLIADAIQPFTTLIQLKKLKITIQAPATVLYTDRKMVTTILRNLFANAQKFTPDGGEIRVVFELREGAGQFRVEDTGPGIPTEVLDQLAKGQTPSSTNGTNGEVGSGLGLSLCRNFARLLGGQLWFESRSEGAAVALLLPAADSSSKKKPAPTGPALFPRSGREN